MRNEQRLPVALHVHVSVLHAIRIYEWLRVALHYCQRDAVRNELRVLECMQQRVRLRVAHSKRTRDPVRIHLCHQQRVSQRVLLREQLIVSVRVGLALRLEVFVALHVLDTLAVGQRQPEPLE